jgi:hypothetical protein
MKDNKGFIFLILLVLVAMHVANGQGTESSRAPSSVSETKLDTTSVSNHTFKYTYSGQAWQVDVNNKKWADAFDEAAQKCFKHFYKKGTGEQTGLDVIDVCANPSY